MAYWNPNPKCGYCERRFPSGNGRFCSALCWLRYFGWT